ncbi:MAG: alpha/beta hydrolase [Myxococcales bacterium]|nr:alpha/beta hydrolase [Myxococcales bacterium]
MMNTRWTIEHGMSVRRIGEGPELVWIHGLGESSTSFESSVVALPGFTHVLPDLPGYGRSAWPTQVVNLDELASMLAKWLAERPPAIVIGHSMGGVLALLIAERAPVRAIVDIEGNLSKGDCTFSGKAVVYSREDFAERGLGELRHWIYEMGFPDPPLRGYFAAMSMACPDVFHQHALDLVELSKSEVLAARLAKLSVPALYVAGVPDGICMRSRALLMEHKVRWVGIEKAAHWVYADQPEQFIKEVTAFLQGV